MSASASPRGSYEPARGTHWPSSSTSHQHALSSHHHTPHHHTAPPPAPILRLPRGVGRHPSSRAPSPVRTPGGSLDANAPTGGILGLGSSSSSSGATSPHPLGLTASAPGSEMPSPPHSPPLHSAGSSGAVTFLPQLAPSQTHASGPASLAPAASNASPSAAASSTGASSRSRSPAATSTGIRMPSRVASGSLGGLSEKGGAWERKVGFDTMPDADETVSGEFSYTLQVKSRGYRRTKNTRTFMCAFDTNAYSERALEWLMESLVEDGDEVVALRVLEGEADSIDQDEAREEARELIDSIVDLNDDVEERRISIVVEFVAGHSVTSTVLRMLHVYRPDSLTVGTRGKTPNAFAKLLGGASMGSVSREILSRSPVPVVVVRPEAKVHKHRKKRQEDPKRRSYHDLVAKAHSLPLSRDSSHQEASRFHGHAHFSPDDGE